jgi:DNA gyrase subunit A
MGRSAQGVKILSIDKPDFVIGVDRIVREEAAEVPAGSQDTQAELFDNDAPEQ